MKAKDYADKYNANPAPEALGQIFMDFLGEIGTIARARNTTSDEGVLAIVDEQDRKWRAFARMTDLPESGFMALLELDMPEIHTALVMRRRYRI
jgi:hypothetical protein